MIKIKDDFDLDKLIGFVKDKYGYYRFEDIKENSDAGVEIIITPDRKVIISTIDECWGENSEEIPSMLYNLFKMGIIEEVRSE